MSRARARPALAAAAATLAYAAALAVSPAACGTSGVAPAADAGAEASAADAPADRRARPDGPSLPPVTGPERLSQAGLYSDFAARTLAPEVTPFTVRDPFWSDGADKSRFVLLPPGTKVDTSDMDVWMFPVGTKFFKELRVGGKLIETRMLWKQQADVGTDGWWMAAYVWRDDGSDADVALEGVKNAKGTTHDVPPQEECLKCHMDMGDVGIGFSAHQLSSSPPGTGTLGKLIAAGRLTNPPPAELAVPGTGVVQQTLAYVHANCGHCHNGRQQVLANQSPIRLNLRASDTTPERTQLSTTTIGVKMKHVLPGDIDTAVVPKDPDKSGLWVRAQRRDHWAMPPFASKQVDPASGVVRDWILQLP